MKQFKFERNGFVVLDDFLTSAQNQGLLDEIGNIIRDKSFVEHLEKLTPAERFINVNRSNSTSIDQINYFSKQNFQTDTHSFLNSHNMMRGFIEPRAKIEDYSDIKQLIQDKIGRIGYSLHSLNPVFKAATCNEKTEVRAIKNSNNNRIILYILIGHL